MSIKNESKNYRSKTRQERGKSGAKKKYEWIFINGKQVRVERLETIEGMLIEDYIAENADDIWLHQNERWDLLDARYSEEDTDFNDAIPEEKEELEDKDLPF